MRWRGGLLFVLLPLLPLLPLLASASSPNARPLTARALQQLIDTSLTTARPVELQGQTVELGADVVSLSSDRPLRIQGPGTITGSGHSLFQAGGNRQQLQLAGLNLVHLTSDVRAEKREQGAAVFVRGKAEVLLQECQVSSQGGYGLWVVQKARVQLDRCRISEVGRSGVVCFGNAIVSVVRSTIHDVGIHGICARGNTRLSLRDSVISAAAVRGIYVYHNATLALESVHVTDTGDADAAAIQAEALREGDCVCLTMDGDCALANNRGRGLSVAGHVDCRLQGSAAKLPFSRLSATQRQERHSAVPLAASDRRR